MEELENLLELKLVKYVESANSNNDLVQKSSKTQEI